MDPDRIPVIVGTGQVPHRPRCLNQVQEPVEPAARTARLAAEDAGNPGLLARLEMVRVVSILIWGYADSAPFGRELEALAPPPLPESPSGEAVVETCSVVYQDGEPKSGFFIARNPAGQRFLSRAEKSPGTPAAMVAGEMIGKRGSVHCDPASGLNEFRP